MVFKYTGKKLAKKKLRNARREFKVGLLKRWIHYVPGVNTASIAVLVVWVFEKHCAPYRYLGTYLVRSEDAWFANHINPSSPFIAIIYEALFSQHFLPSLRLACL